MAKREELKVKEQVCFQITSEIQKKSGYDSKQNLSGGIDLKADVLRLERVIVAVVRREVVQKHEEQKV